jgi:hypothetical protein
MFPPLTRLAAAAPIAAVLLAAVTVPAATAPVSRAIVPAATSGPSAQAVPQCGSVESIQAGNPYKATLKLEDLTAQMTYTFLPLTAQAGPTSVGKVRAVGTSIDAEGKKTKEGPAETSSWAALDDMLYQWGYPASDEITRPSDFQCDQTGTVTAFKATHYQKHVTEVRDPQPDCETVNFNNVMLAAGGFTCKVSAYRSSKLHFSESVVTVYQMSSAH